MLCCAGAVANDDPVRKALDDAKAAYDKASKDYLEEVERWFEKEDDAARKLKSGVAEKVKQVAAEKKEFADSGTLPKRIPLLIKERPTRAADALLKAYKAASDEYYRRKKDDEAAAVEKESSAFKNDFSSGPRPDPKKPKPAALKAPFDEKEASAAQEAWAAYLGRKPVEEIGLPGKATMKFVLIPPGTFKMGSPKDETDNKDEGQHEVVIPRPFYLATTETTQKQYTAFGDKNPSEFKGDDSPVENVSWVDAAAFCRKLTDKVRPKGVKAFRLPTEAQWEYACRAGTTTKFYFGNEMSQADARFGNPEGKRSPATVGSYKPNAFGLYDMHGNLWELCEDHFGPYDKASAAGDFGPVQASKQATDARVCRGGAFDADIACCRSAGHRGSRGQKERVNFIGFRVAYYPD